MFSNDLVFAFKHLGWKSNVSFFLWNVGFFAWASLITMSGSSLSILFVDSVITNFPTHCNLFVTRKSIFIALFFCFFGFFHSTVCSHSLTQTEWWTFETHTFHLRLNKIMLWPFVQLAHNKKKITFWGPILFHVFACFCMFCAFCWWFWFFKLSPKCSVVWWS